MSSKVPCNYAIIRFRPYVETEEFANVGVMLISPRERFFDFRLLQRRHSRITRFFHEMEPSAFRFSMKLMEEELARVRSLLKSFAFDRRRKYTPDHRETADDILEEVVRTRETTIVFSEMRATLADDPKKKLNELFAYYVERNFVTKKYRETLLENNLKTMLKRAQVLQRYERRILGDEEFKVTIPFVEQVSTAPRLIKPINLGQENSTKIIEHGNNWQFRVKELQTRQNIDISKVLFATEGPISNRTGSRNNAFLRSCGMLEELGVQVIPIKDESRIIEFAATN